MHTGDPYEACGTAIDVYFLDMNAVVYAAGVWDYSSAHGWWLDAVMASPSPIDLHRAALLPGPVGLHSADTRAPHIAYFGPKRRTPRRRKLRT